MELDEQTKKKVLLKIFSESIEEFGRFFFPNHIRLETPRFHRQIYDLYESSSTRIAIGAPRGHAKSTITDLVYLAWEILAKGQKDLDQKDNHNFVLLVSDTYSQAVLFLEALKAEFESNERLQAFYGTLVSDSWSEGEIIVKDTMIKAIGAGMKVRGLKFRESRPTLVICDDLENDEMVENRDRRQKLERWVNGALIPCMTANGRIVFIGTILHFDSLLAKLLSADQYTEFRKRIYRAISLETREALWPEHLNLEALEQIKSDYVSKGQGSLFYQEYQNEPLSDEDRKFRIEKMKYYTEDQISKLELSTFMTVDRAYSKSKSADATGIIILSVDKENNWYVRLAERFKGTEREIINKIFDLRAYFHLTKIGIEQKAFEYTIKPAFDDEMKRRNQFFTIEKLKDLGRAKYVRIEGLTPRFEAGSVFLKKDQLDLIDELIRFPKGIHDDLIDALAYMLTLAERPGNTGVVGTIKPYVPDGKYDGAMVSPNRFAVDTEDISKW